MTDKEQVVYEIEDEIRLAEHWNEQSREVDVSLLEKVLALLKEQEELNDHYQSFVVAYNEMRKENQTELRKEYERGYRNGRADEAGLRDGTIMQTFSPD